MKDVELAEIVVRTRLLLKKEMRREVSDLPARPEDLYRALAHRAVVTDHAPGAAFALPYSAGRRSNAGDARTAGHGPDGLRPRGRCEW